MEKITKPSVVFKPYHQHQDQLFPPNLEELIPTDHLVRMTDQIINAIDLDELIEKYKGGGASSYHPRMLLKAIVYAYTQRIYSGRQIAKALRENIHFMWLSGQSQPDFRTINQFRSERLAPYMEVIFTQVIQLLMDGGFIKLEHLFVDGTKILADANRYSFVWKRATDKYRHRLRQQVRELLSDIDQLNAQENSEYGERDYAEMGEDAFIDPEVLKQVVSDINNQISGKSDNAHFKKAKRQLERDYIPRAEKYKDHEQTFAGRNSFSKTDPDATFMRMKEDPMRNGQLKPGYNVQVATENQFIVSYGLYPNPTDTKTLIPFLERWLPRLPHYPKNIIADAGYGSEENYSYLSKEDLVPYVKYNRFHLEQKKRRSDKDRYRTEYWNYDSERDEFICPDGRRLVYQETRTYQSEGGYESKRSHYLCESCEGCAHRSACHGGKGSKQMQVSHALRAFRQRAKERLLSEQGKVLRSQRPIEVESAFGQIKHNREFRRFRLRGKKKVSTEWGLVCLAHNIAKMNKQKGN